MKNQFIIHLHSDIIFLFLDFSFGKQSLKRGCFSILHSDIEITMLWWYYENIITEKRFSDERQKYASGNKHQF